MNFRGSSSSSSTPKTQRSTTPKSSPKKAARTTTSHTTGPNLGRSKDRTGNRAPGTIVAKLILLVSVLLIACTVVIKTRRTRGEEGPSSSLTAAAKLTSDRTTALPHKTSTTTIRTTRNKNKHKSKYKYPMPDATVPPSHCTAEQLIALERQLSSTGCETPWVSKCSFRVLTQGCQDPVLAREYYAYDYNFTTHGFLGVLIGYDHDDTPIDLLHIGNRQDPTYNVSTWNTVLNKTVPCVRKSIPYHRSTSNTKNRMENKPGVGVVVAPPQVLVIETYPPPSTEAASPAQHLTLEQLKFRTLLADEALLIHRVHQGYRSLNDVPSEDLRTVLETTTTRPPPSSPPRAIQWFQIGNRADGAEYKIITDLLDTEFMREVRYLKFEYNFKGSWHWKQQPHQLSTLIDKLQTSVGMFCYWSGSSENGNMLWRITGCFLPHFDSHQFARIQCISTQHSDVADLAFAMESKFLTLLQGTYTSF